MREPLYKLAASYAIVYTAAGALAGGYQMEELSGNLNYARSEGSTARIIAVGSRASVLAETHVKDDGSWKLQSPETPEWILASLCGRRIAALAIESSRPRELRLPALYTLRFEFPSAPVGAMLWLDPIDIEGFPPELLGTLRTHADHTIDLHLGELPATGTQQFQAQRGKYRISGGRISIHLETATGPRNFMLARIVDEKSRTTLLARNGEIIMTVQEDRSYQAFFVPVT